MKIKKYLIIPVLAMTLMTGCGNKTFDKAMEEGKLAIANKEYEKAEGMFNLAIEENKDDKEANALYNQIQKLIQAMKLKEDGNIEEVIALCEDIEKIESESEGIKKEANILKDECNAELSKIEEDTEDEIEDTENKVAENQVKKEDIQNKKESKKDKYLQKLSLIEDEVSNISYDGDTLQMKEASMTVLSKWDDLLNEIYGELKSQLSSSEMSSLKAEQRQWISNRDAIAEEESLEFEGGTMEGLQYTETLGRLTKERCYELVELYMK